MSAILLTLGTFVLILVSLFLILVILMQRANANAGLGAAFGGGMADSAFGAEAGNILTKATIWATVAFFVLALVLYLGYMGTMRSGPERSGLTPVFEEEQDVLRIPPAPGVEPSADAIPEDAPDPPAPAPAGGDEGDS